MCNLNMFNPATILYCLQLAQLFGWQNSLCVRNKANYLARQENCPAYYKYWPTTGKGICIDYITKLHATIQIVNQTDCWTADCSIFPTISWQKYLSLFSTFFSMSITSVSSPTLMISTCGGLSYVIFQLADVLKTWSHLCDVVCLLGCIYPFFLSLAWIKPHHFPKYTQIEAQAGAIISPVSISEAENSGPARSVPTSTKTNKNKRNTQSLHEKVFISILTGPSHSVLGVTV